MNKQQIMCINMIKFEIKRSTKYGSKKGDMFRSLNNIHSWVKTMEEVDGNSKT